MTSIPVNRAPVCKPAEVNQPTSGARPIFRLIKADDMEIEQEIKTVRTAITDRAKAGDAIGMRQQMKFLAELLSKRAPVSVRLEEKERGIL